MPNGLRTIDIDLCGDTLQRYLTILRGDADSEGREMRTVIRELDGVLRPQAQRILATGPAGDFSVHADDAVQEWHIRVARYARRRFSGAKHCWWWGYRVLRSICVGIVRREMHRRGRPLGACEVEDTNAKRHQAYEELRGDVRQALGLLSAAESRAIDLVFFQGMTYTAAAEVEGIRRGAMVYRTGRALAKLKARLSSES